MTNNRDSVALILAPEQDLHARSVQQRYNEMYGGSCIIVDTVQMPDYALTIQPGIDPSWQLSLSNRNITAKDCHAIWRRRPKYPASNKDLKTEGDKFLARTSYRNTLDGWLYCCAASGIRIMNDLDAENSATNKIHQLLAAKAVGLSIPGTAVSNSADAIREFSRQKDGGICYKPFQSPPDKLIPTAILSPEDIDALYLLSLAPTIFQSFIAGRDIRVTVVGDAVFAVEIVPQITEALTDWRIAIDNRIIPFTLKESDRNLIQALMSRLHLQFGALDFKLVDDELIFLEVNPGGQFLFAEIHTGAEISAAVAAWLHAGARLTP